MIEPYDWQKPRVQRLVEILKAHPAALDASATGTGKTVTSIAAALALGSVPFVIAPKSVISMWRLVAAEMKAEVLDVVNIEKLRTGKTKWVSKLGPKAFKWNLPEGALIICDECHKISGQDTQNSRLLAVAKPQKIKVLAMSATPYDDPRKMKTLGYLLGAHNFSAYEFWAFCRKFGCYPSQFHKGLDFPKGPAAQQHLARLHVLLAPKTVRQTVDSVPEFPENSISCELFDLDKEFTQEINAIEAEFKEALTKSPASAVEKRLRARQCTELRKVPLLVDLADDLVAEGNSVVLFASFRDTVDLLYKELSKKYGVSKIIGGQTQAARDAEVHKFQSDQSIVCVATTSSGGQSISLHHLASSTRPRRALITPGDSAIEFQQCLGRIHRAGALSKSIQLIVLAAGTIEEGVYKNLQRKLKQIETLIDGDLVA